MERKAWTEEDLNKLRDLLFRGYTYKEVASALGRSYDSIRSIVKRLRTKSDFLFSESPISEATSCRSSRSKGLLDLFPEEVKGLLNKGSCEKILDEEVKMDKDRTTKVSGGESRSGQKTYNSSWVLSDKDVSEIIERYLKRTKNIEGARNLWKLHIQYKNMYRRRVG